MSEIERMPASFSLAINQAGDGRVGSTPRTARVTNTLAPVRPRIGPWSSMVTGNSDVETTGSTANAGSLKEAPVACEYSRATPRIEKA